MTDQELSKSLLKAAGIEWQMETKLGFPCVRHNGGLYVADLAISLDRIRRLIFPVLKEQGKWFQLCGALEQILRDRGLVYQLNHVLDLEPREIAEACLRVLQGSEA